MSDFTVIDENSEHSNFTILQNILSKIGLTAFERSLYWAIRESAFDGKKCTKSYANLAIMSGMSEPSVKRTIKMLEIKNEIIKKPLISVRIRFSKLGEQETNEITLTNLWDSNYEFFKEKFGEVTQTPHPNELKKCFGRSHRPHPRSHRPPNKTSVKISNNVKKQQQEPAAPVAVFSCLRNLEDDSITEKEKIRLTKKYFNQEQRVIDAVNAITQSGFEPDETLLKSLRAACKGEWKPKVSNNKDFTKNKELAEKLEKVKHVYRFDPYPEYILIVKGMKTESVKYEQSYKKFTLEIEEKANIKLNEIFK